GRGSLAGKRARGEIWAGRRSWGGNADGAGSAECGWPAPGGVTRSDGGGLFVFGEVAGLVRVHRDAGAHGGGDRGLLDVAALGGGGLEAGDLVHGGRVVLQQ